MIPQGWSQELDTGQTGQAFVCLLSSTVSESFFPFHAILSNCPIFTISQIKVVDFICFAFNMVFFSTITLFVVFKHFCTFSTSDYHLVLLHWRQSESGTVLRLSFGLGDVF